MRRMWKALAIAAMGLTLAACSKVPAGNVGVKVNLLGGAKGVEIEELGVGRYWIGINEELFLFPTFTQNHTYQDNQVISFQTKEGLAVQANIGISYRIPPQNASKVFQKYRKGVDEITSIYLFNMVRDALVKHSSYLNIDSVYGTGKVDLINAVQADLKEQLEPIGIELEKVYWVGQLALPENVIESINNKIKATQMSEQRENEIRQAKAEAQKVKEAAEGEAQAMLTVARAEAEAISIKGNAIRNNPQVIELNKVERWDGVLPKFVGGDTTPLINLN